MSVRTYPYKYKPTPHDEQMIEEALRSQLFVVSEIGPTQFLIKGESSPAKFKVTLGDPQLCSGCTPKRASTGGKSPDLCIHIFFVMLKILRLPRTNSLVWQASLLDTEISNILGQRYQRLEERAARRRMQAAGAGSSASAASSSASVAAADAAAAAVASSGAKDEPGSGRVPKRDLDADDVCPICQDDLVDPSKVEAPAAGTPPLLPLVYCQWSCGQQLHAKCMRVWAEHQLATVGKSLACPMCRQPWTSSHPQFQLTNEQIVRELRVAEHAPVVYATAAPSEQEDGESSTAVVVRAPVASASSTTAPSASSASAARASLQCCSCRKLLPLREGRFMRCVHCTDAYNLCRVCFIRSKGIGGGSVPTPLLTNRSNHVHCFVEAKPSTRPAVAAAPGEAPHSLAAAAAQAEFPYAYGVEWIPAPVKAPPVSSQLALTLQSRELTHADYELLLGLDESTRGQRPMMHSYLMRTLPVPVMRDGGECVLCSRTILATQPLRSLPCFHQVHESCLQSQLMYDVLLSCPVDAHPLFPGLAFCEAKSVLRKKKPTLDEQALLDATRAGALPHAAGSMMFGLSGTGMGGAPSRLAAASLPDDDADDTATTVEAPSAAVSHSHHFQLGSASTVLSREQRAATAAAPGRLRTGTAAFALPTTSAAQRDARSNNQELFAAPLQLSGSSGQSTSGDAPLASAASSSIRRGRAHQERTTAPTLATAFVPDDVASLVIGSSSGSGVGVRASPAGRLRGHGLSSMFAPSHSPVPSPERSPTRAVDLSVDALGVQQADGRREDVPVAAAPRSASRPRVGRTTQPVSREPAPSLAQLLVGTGAAPQARSASASMVRPSAAFAQTRTTPARVPTSSGVAASPGDLSVGSATGTLLTSGGSARASTGRRVSGMPAAVAHTRPSENGAGADELALAVSSFSASPDSSPVAAPVRTNSASRSRRTVAPEAAASPLAAPLSGLGSLQLAGSTLNNVDRSDIGRGGTDANSRGRAVASSAGKLRRGKTALSTGAAQPIGFQ